MFSIKAKLLALLAALGLAGLAASAVINDDGPAVNQRSVSASPEWVTSKTVHPLKAPQHVRPAHPHAAK